MVGLNGRSSSLMGREQRWTNANDKMTVKDYSFYKTPCIQKILKFKLRRNGEKLQKDAGSQLLGSRGSFGFEIVTSVTPFGWSRRPVRFAGKQVHRPAKFLHRGSCRLKRIST